jgi:hypothetical protein
MGEFQALINRFARFVCSGGIEIILQDHTPRLDDHDFGGRVSNSFTSVLSLPNSRIQEMNRNV